MYEWVGLSGSEGEPPAPDPAEAPLAVTARTNHGDITIRRA